MMKTKSRRSNSNCSKFGIPIYGVSWTPRHLQLTSPPKEAGHGNVDLTPDISTPSSSSRQTVSADECVILAGGGGEGRSGIPNALLLSPFDFTSSSFPPDPPVVDLNLGSELPYRIAVHSGGEGVICALPKSCKWLEWEAIKHNDVLKPRLKLSSKEFDVFEDIGQQLSVCFSHDASVLALGGEDGKLRVFKWPSMEEIANRNIYTSVKDLDFSPDGKFLISSGSGGPCRIWDAATVTVVASLAKQRDDVFGFCRFCQFSDERGLVLYTTMVQGGGGSIVEWSSVSWQRVGSKKTFNDPISAFSVSPDGKFLSVGTVEGDIHIINSGSLKTHKVVKNAHMGVVTALAFSHNSRGLVSASLDSSARVTLIPEKTKRGTGLWVIILVVVLVAVAVAVFSSYTTS